MEAQTINEYQLLQMGLTLKDIDNIDAERADKLLLFHNCLKEEEERQMKKAQRGK